MFDVSKDGDVTVSNFFKFGRILMKIPDSEVRKVFSNYDLDLQDELSLEQFKKIFKEHKNSKIFSWYTNLREGPQNLVHSSIMDINKKQSPKAECDQLPKDVMKRLRIFFNELTSDGQISASLDKLSNYLKGIKIADSLKLRIVRSFYYASGSKKCLSFDIFVEIIYILCKENKIENRLSYLFDIYSEYSESGKID